MSLPVKWRQRWLLVPVKQDKKHSGDNESHHYPHNFRLAYIGQNFISSQIKNSSPITFIDKLIRLNEKGLP
jgi:hypothetical protein